MTKKELEQEVEDLRKLAELQEELIEAQIGLITMYEEIFEQIKRDEDEIDEMVRKILEIRDECANYS